MSNKQSDPEILCVVPGLFIKILRIYKDSGHGWQPQETNPWPLEEERESGHHKEGRAVADN